MKKLFFSLALVLFLMGMIKNHKHEMGVFWNLKQLQSFSALIFPHHVNSLSKLQHIQRNGLKGFEVDLIWNREKNVLLVCHGKKECDILTLEDMLKASSSAHFIWLDIKNIKEKNYHDILGRLISLDKKYKIKSRVLVESSKQSSFWGEFKTNGFNTSYYLPTKKMKLNPSDGLAEKLAVYINVHAIKNISFDCAMYEFVKKKLLPKLKVQPELYVWSTTYAFHKFSLKEKLAKDSCIKNSKVALIDYKL